MMFRNPRLVQYHFTLFITMSRTFSNFFNFLGLIISIFDSVHASFSFNYTKSYLLGLLGINKECFTDNVTNTSSASNENSIKDKTNIRVRWSSVFFDFFLKKNYLQLSIKPRTFRFCNSNSTAITNNTRNSFLVTNTRWISRATIELFFYLHQPTNQHKRSNRALQEHIQNKSYRGSEVQNQLQEPCHNE